MDRLGGLGKKMPWTSILFLVGAVSICALPPFNGFVGEFLLYLGVFSHNDVSAGISTSIFATTIIGGLALIGGLAAACFTKAFGIVFLGEPRTDITKHAHEAGAAMKIAMAIPAVGCLAAGVFSPKIFPIIGTVISEVIKMPTKQIWPQIARSSGVLWQVVEIGSVFVGMVLILAIARWWLLRGRTVGTGPTWDCGYASASSRIQYTGSSFTQPIVALFKMFIRSKKTVNPPSGLFPQSASMKTETPDICTEYAYRPGFVWVGERLSMLRWLQQGRVQMYVLYIALTLWILLMWKLR
jgi:NADH:ubiquinone oxidoreductase subunit 5 (subunit L)/multisubunit Na+/H+ antiporter MnhA subunit